MRGRKPLPIETHEANGNPSKKNLTRARAESPRISDHNGKAPSRLSRGAAKVWRHMFPVLQSMRLMTEADEAALVELCESIHEAQFYRDELETLRKQPGGDLVETKSGYKTVHPYVARAGMASDRAMRILLEFGLTPSARTRVAVAPEEKADSLLSFVGGLN